MVICVFMEAQKERYLLHDPTHAAPRSNIFSIIRPGGAQAGHNGSASSEKKAPDSDKPEPVLTGALEIRGEIRKELTKVIKVRGAEGLEKWLNENGELMQYVVADIDTLSLKVDVKGNTVAHHLSKASEAIALKLLDDLKVACIYNNDGDSVCMVAALKYESAARKAAGNIGLWEISNPNSGNSVGHMISTKPEYLNILLGVLGRSNASEFLSVENDRCVSVAAAGTIHRTFSLEVLKLPEVFSIINNDGTTVAEEAVRRHFTSARAVIQSKEQFMKVFDIVQYSRLMMLAEEKKKQGEELQKQRQVMR